MGEECLKQFHTYHECSLTSNIITLCQFKNFPNFGLKYHLPWLQSPVWGGGGLTHNFMWKALYSKKYFASTAIWKNHIACKVISVKMTLYKKKHITCKVQFVQKNIICFWFGPDPRLGSEAWTKLNKNAYRFKILHKIGTRTGTKD